MAEDSENETLDIDDVLDVNNDGMAVVVHAGKDFEPTPRLAAALEELAEAMADAETDEVAGFAFEPHLAFDAGVDFSAPTATGFIKVGCIGRGGDCDGKVTCKGTYSAFQEMQRIGL